MPLAPSSEVFASWLAEFVASLFAAAVAFSFRRAFPRADLPSWGWAWCAAAVWAGLGLIAFTAAVRPAEFTLLRAGARSAATLQAVLFLTSAHSLVASGVTPAWLRRSAIALPLLGAASAVVSAQALPNTLDLFLRAFASITVGAASLASAAWMLRRRGPAAATVGVRVMAVSLLAYGLLKLVSPTTLNWLGLLRGDAAGYALFIGFALAPATFALGLGMSLLEERERALVAERDRLRVSEEKFAKLFRGSPDAILLTRPLAGGVIVDVNESFQAITGFSAAEAVGKTTVDLGFLGESERQALVQEGIAKARLRDREIEFVALDGEQRAVSLNAEWIEIGGEPHMLGVARDVTERRLSERRLRESEERLRRMVEDLRRSEELFRAVVEDQTEMIVRWKPDGTRTFVNQAYCRVFGGSPEKLVGTSFLPLVAEEYREDVLRKIAALTPASPVATSIHESVAESGERLWQEWTDRGIFDAAGRLLELQSTGRDISERRLGEQRLRESEERLRLALDAAHMGIWEWNPETGAVVWSERMREIVGFAPSQGDAVRHYFDRVHPDDRESLERLVRGAVAGDLGQFLHEHRVCGDDGVMRWVEARAKVFRLDGRVVLRGTVASASERKQAEEALRVSEERLRRMSEASFEGICFSENGVVIDANQQYARMFGYALDELIGKRIEDMAAPDHRSLVAAAVRTQETSAYEHLALRKDGTSFTVEVRGRPLVLAGRTLRVTAVRDMSEREELLERLELVGRATNDAVWDWDLRSGQIWWSERIYSLFGYRQPERQPELSWRAERLHPDDRERVRASLRATIDGGGQVWSDEYRFRRADDSYATVLDRGFVLRGPDGRALRVVGAMLDITENRRTQEALRRSERMAAMGSLVAGVAHEIRTPLFSISATLDAYRGRLHDPRELAEFSELLRSQADRLRGLTHDLLNYGRPPALQLNRGRIESVIQRAVRACAGLALERGVTVREELPAGLGEVERDPARLEQVFENLISNAVHHAPRGTSVRVAATASDSGTPGVVCAVEDQGPGIPPEDLGRLFEPFFSRRKGGTGLGLAIVQRIVEDHGGSVQAANRPGGGAIFTVFLPETKARAA